MNFDLEKFKGVFVALYTTYDDEGNICESRAKQLTRYYIEKRSKKDFMLVVLLAKVCCIVNKKNENARSCYE